MAPVHRVLQGHQQRLPVRSRCRIPGSQQRNPRPFSGRVPENKPRIKAKNAPGQIGNPQHGGWDALRREILFVVGKGFELEWVLTLPVPDFDKLHELCFSNYAQSMLTTFNLINIAVNGDKKSGKEWSKPWLKAAKINSKKGIEDLRRDIGNGI